ncbi:MAG: hypothetical protein AAB393_00215, partial [Bacteroidota bacterium]
PRSFTASQLQAPGRFCGPVRFSGQIFNNLTDHPHSPPAKFVAWWQLPTGNISSNASRRCLQVCRKNAFINQGILWQLSQLNRAQSNLGFTLLGANTIIRNTIPQFHT